MSIWDTLAGTGALKHVAVPAEIKALLKQLTPEGATDHPGPGITIGKVRLSGDLSPSPIPGFDLNLTVPADPVEPAPYKLWLDRPAPDATAFKFWLVLSEQGQARLALAPLDKAPGLALTGADIVPAAEGGFELRANGRKPVLVSRSDEAGTRLGPALLISGSATAGAGMTFTVDTDSSTGGVIALGLDPPAVVFGGSRIGFRCPVVVLDDSGSVAAAGQGAPGLRPPKPSIDADDPPWRGLLAREIDFYLPPGVPFLGGQPIKGYFELPAGPTGPQLVVQTTVPPKPGAGGASARPGYSVRIECLDPTATGLSGLVPTLISATMDLDLHHTSAELPGKGPIGFLSGKPVRITTTFARDPVNAPGQFRVAVGVSAQGADGIVAIDSSGGLLAPKIFNIAAMSATAIIADGGSSELVKFALAGQALSGMFKPDSRFVLNSAEIASSGHGLPVGGRVSLTLDYSVSALVKHIGISSGFGVEMTDNHPMRIRVRNARMSVDPRKSGLDMFSLDLADAEMEVENPGAWNVTGLDRLFDVLGSRSGRGSTWVEVDLRFKLNLGPVRVSGVTLRATLPTGGGTPKVSLSGIAAALRVPGVVEGAGTLRIIQGGFAAHIETDLVPIKIAADATVIYKDPMVVLKLAVDLPAPIPLANTGFGLFGIGGLLGVAAQPDYGREPFPGAGPVPDDPLLKQLYWRPEDETSFSARPGQTTFGLDAALGTLPDLGFSFSTKAAIMITVPDVAIRGALNGKIMSPPVRVTDATYTPKAFGVTFLGFISVDPDALTFAVIGSVNLRPLLEITIPLAGRFPFGTDADDWFTYLGADGYPDQGRSIGPITAKVLPDILGTAAEAYLMMRGRGIEKWPHGRQVPSLTTLGTGFVIAFGFALEAAFGPKPIAWAQLYASLDVLIGAKPPTLSGFGAAGGSLHLGPFSLGVHARMSFFSQNDTSYFWAEVTGRIELLFFDIEGTVTITFGDEDLKPTLPKPDRHPLDRLGPPPVAGAPPGILGSLPVLTDDSYRVVARLAEDPAQIKAEDHVWPDALISIPFAFAPHVAPSASAQFDLVAGPNKPLPPARIGSEMLRYEWTLDELSLVDVTDSPDKTQGGKPVGGAGIRLPARWQVNRGGGDVCELLLLSLSGDLWVSRRSDAGRQLPHDPLHQSTNACGREVAPVPGWAIGLPACMQEDGFRLPPDPVSLDRLFSRVEAELHHFARDRETFGLYHLDQVHTLPTAFSLHPARIMRWERAHDVGDRLLGGHIFAQRLDRAVADGFGAPSGTEWAEQVIELDLDEEITEGFLVLVGDLRTFESAEHFGGVIVESGSELWPRDHAHGGQEVLPGLCTVVYRQADGAEPTKKITISYPLGVDLGVAGLRAMTVSATAYARDDNDQTSRLTDALEQAAAAGPLLDPLLFGRHQRMVLRPGRLYRLDLGLSWKGWLSRQDETGTVKLDHVSPDFETTYQRGNDPNAATRRQLFFRTAHRAAAAVPAAGSKDYVKFVHLRQDTFEPELVERYLAGYEPAQSEMFRFADDPLRVHFRHGHTPALARAYGFTLKVAVRRIDRPGGDEDAETFRPEWTAITDRRFLSPADQARFDDIVASPCRQPKPGATATLTRQLATQAWYEVYVRALTDTPATVRHGRLPGVTFRTSRWRDVRGMLLGLGFAVGATAGDDVTVGDLQIPGVDLPGAGVVEGDDHAFDAALTALGLGGWPTAAAPRLSRLWVADGTRWRFAGLLMESPEPIHRPGRVDVSGPGGGLRLEMGASGSGTAFTIRRRDTGAFRLLYLTPSPFVVVDHERLTDQPETAVTRYRELSPTLSFRVGTAGTGEGDVDGRVLLPLAPDFAEDP